MINKEKILNDIEKIITEKLGIALEQRITEDTDFLKDGLGLDSIMVLELIIELELMYDIEMDEDELNTDYFKKASLLAEFIINKIDEK